MLRAFFTPDPADYLFSPARAVEEILAARGEARKTPRFPSHMRRNAAKRVKHPQRKPAEKYNTQTYGLAVDRACDRAFPPPGDLAQRADETRAAWVGRLTEGEMQRVRVWRKEHRWHPNQLRHAFATRVRKQHGLEAARVLLGNSRADVTQVYAEKNVELASAIAAKVG